jgi:hypothetical protein
MGDDQDRWRIVIDRANRMLKQSRTLRGLSKKLRQESDNLKRESDDFRTAARIKPRSPKQTAGNLGCAGRERLSCDIVRHR